MIAIFAILGSILGGVFGGIPGIVFAAMTVLCVFIPMNPAWKMVTIAAFGFPQLIFISHPLLYSAILCLLCWGILSINRNLTFTTLIISIIVSLLAGLILYSGNCIIGVVIIGLIFTLFAYLIFVSMYRMNKSLHIKER